MLEEKLLEVCQIMAESLNEEQIQKLQNVLFVKFHGKEIKEETYDVQVADKKTDAYKIRAFQAAKKISGRQDNTMKQYIREIVNCRNSINKNFDDITTMDLRWYYGMMREHRGISMATMQTRLRYLSSFWDFLISESLAHSNPVKKVGAVKIEKTIKKPFSSEELEKLRTACDNLRDRAIIEFLYSTGVRVSELVALNTENIEMGKQELIVYGKGSKERKTYLTDSAKFYLKRYLKWRGAKENEPLFVTKDAPHNRLTVAGIQYMLRQLGKKAGVENTHPHRFRRTIATDLLNRGMPIEQVKEFLGHEKLDTTMIYCTVKEENVHASHKKYA